MKHREKELQYQEWRDTKEEFTYPMWFKNKHYDLIARFESDSKFEVVKSKKSMFPVGYVNITSRFTSHKNKDNWEQVESPNEHLDRLDDMVDEAIKEVIDEEYQKPIQYRNGIDTFQRARANLSKDKVIACIQFNIDKYNWREKDQDIEDFEKIIDYAKFAIKVLKDS